MTKRLTVKEVARVLGVCVQRVNAKIKSGHFNGVSKCECGISTVIPADEVYKNLMRGKHVRKENKGNE